MAKTYRTSREIRLPAWRGKYTLVLPAGLRVKPISQGGYAGKFFLDEFPPAIFAPGSFLLHDAVHYSIVLEPGDVD